MKYFEFLIFLSPSIIIFIVNVFMFAKSPVYMINEKALLNEKIFLTLYLFVYSILFVRLVRPKI